MIRTLVTPKIRPHHPKAEAHKRMALAALRSDSSLSVRLARYNAHMAKARASEVAGTTPRPALATSVIERLAAWLMGVPA